MPSFFPINIIVYYIIKNIFSSGHAKNNPQPPDFPPHNSLQETTSSS